MPFFGFFSGKYSCCMNVLPCLTFVSSCIVFGLIYIAAWSQHSISKTKDGNVRKWKVEARDLRHTLVQHRPKVVLVSTAIAASTPLSPAAAIAHDF